MSSAKASEQFNALPYEIRVQAIPCMIDHGIREMRAEQEYLRKQCKRRCKFLEDRIKRMKVTREERIEEAAK